jgi:pimeloyl-ACP methyl ester carboxylesterase
VCLHDVGMNGNVFAGVLDALAEHHSPLAFDLPAHGRSGRLDSLETIAAMAAHTGSLADRLGLDAPVLLGDGMGAAVALEAAAGWTTPPAALVLLGGVTADPGPLEDEIDLLRRITGGKARREFDRTGYAPDTDRAVYQRAFGEWLKTDPRATLGDVQALAAWSITDWLPNLTTPTLVVVGEHEEPDRRATAEAVADQLPAGRLVTLPGAGRRGVLEQPAALADLVHSFLGELTAA